MNNKKPVTPPPDPVAEPIVDEKPLSDIEFLNKVLDEYRLSPEELCIHLRTGSKLLITRILEGLQDMPREFHNRLNTFVKSKQARGHI